MGRVAKQQTTNMYTVKRLRYAYIHVPVGFKCEASIPKGIIGSLEGFKHRASHSFQYLNSLFLVQSCVGYYRNCVYTHTM